jgi:hypothetical protein
MKLIGLAKDTAKRYRTSQLGDRRALVPVSSAPFTRLAPKRDAKGVSPPEANFPPFHGKSSDMRFQRSAAGSRNANRNEQEQRSD